MSDDPEKAVDAETWIASEKAKQAERKRLKEQYALADVEANTTILKYPIEVSTGVASFDVKSKPKKSKDVKEPLDEALVNEILGEQQSTGNGPNFTFKQAPKEEPKPEDVADEEAVKTEAPSAVRERLQGRWKGSLGTTHCKSRVSDTLLETSMRILKTSF